jgi:hypothetical protein
MTILFQRNTTDISVALTIHIYINEIQALNFEDIQDYIENLRTRADTKELERLGPAIYCVI